MKFSIVIPTSDRNDVLRRALISALAEARPDDEIIVVNDGSACIQRLLADYTASGQVRYGRTQGREGVSTARNLGIDMASGDVICFLDDDDELLAGYLAAVASEFEHSGSDFLWCGKINAYRRKNGKLEFKETTWNRSELKDLSFVIDVAASCGLALKRTAIEKFGRFDTALRTSEDRDLLLRYISMGAKYSIIEKPYVLIHGDACTSLSRVRRDPVRAYRSAMDDELVMARHREKIMADPALRDRYFQALAWKYYDARAIRKYYAVVFKALGHGALTLKMLRRGLALLLRLPWRRLKQMAGT